MLRIGANVLGLHFKSGGIFYLFKSNGISIHVEIVFSLPLNALVKNFVTDVSQLDSWFRTFADSRLGANVLGSNHRSDGIFRLFKNTNFMLILESLTIEIVT